MIRNLSTRMARGVATAALGFGLAPSASAVMFNTDVTPDAIFGSGNANGGYTVEQNAGVELGLRAKVRFDASNQPQNIFNFQGNVGDVGIYKFSNGAPGGRGFGFAADSPSTASWNFEWSINTNFDGSSGLVLGDLTYRIGIDFDAGAGTNFLTFDPINGIEPIAGTVCWDHSMGTNATGNGAGTEVAGCRDGNPAIAAAAAANYAGQISALNVAQNSWNMEFFDDAGGGFPFVGGQAGIYDIYLAAFDGNGNEIARSTIQVHVPEPLTAALLGAGLLGLVRRRRVA